ncbi:MAG: hypothetical protein C4562_00605 [Actinobacteria bacterium]|nr:MAG: hypothetical protein C4562_00605 [Actinomycetota bacterium]
MMYRILSAAIGIPILLLALVFGGGIGFLSLILVIICVCYYEFLKLFLGRYISYYFSLGVITIVALGFAVLYHLWTMLLFVPLILLIMILIDAGAYRQAFVAFLGIFYCSLLLHLVVLRGIEMELVFVVLISTWSFDIGAYLVGKYFGKHKITPNISPNKSYEGLLAGSLLVAIMLFLYPFGWTNPIIKVVFGVIIITCAFSGDLLESKLKRVARVKDTGSIIPGHGGFLDRFDSLLFTGTIVFYLSRFFI